MKKAEGLLKGNPYSDGLYQVILVKADPIIRQ
jgi:hypothetical protein